MTNTNNEAQQSKLPTQLLPNRTAYHTQRAPRKNLGALCVFAVTLFKSFSYL